MPATKRNAPPKKTTSGAPKKQKFVLNYEKPAADKLFDGAAFKSYLEAHFKVDNKAGNIGDKVTFTPEGNGKLVVESSIPVSKRYLKYLVKRYLQKNQSREWLRVVSTDKQTYTLRFFNLGDDADE